jgi:energy-coupling factor transport system substrate-specific component
LGRDHWQLIGDFFGSFGIGSLFGFFGNFAFAYVPYKIWRNLGITPKDDHEPEPKSFKKILSFVVAAALGAFACALIIGWGLDLLNMVPFVATAGIIALNNVIPSIIIGIPLTLLLYPRVKKWDLLWTDILAAEDIPPSGPRQRLGAAIMGVSILVGWFGGFLAATGAGQTLLNSGAAAGGPGTISVALIGGVGCCGLVVSALMQ